MTTRFCRALTSLCFGACALFALAAPRAIAQVANCPFAVSGTSPAKFSVDGMLLVRYAVGLRGAVLSNKISSSATLANAETAITSNLSRLDMDGDNEFGANDALIILRYLAGYSRDAWTSGLTFAL